MPDTPSRDEVEKVFSDPKKIHRFLRDNPQRAPKTEYVEHNGTVLGVKLVWSHAHGKPSDPRHFTTDEAKTFLRRLGFSNFLSLDEANLTTTTQSVRNVLETHRRVERAIWTRNKKIRQAVLSDASCTCAACGLRPADVYDGPEDGCLEGHHIKPMSDFDGREQAVTDSDLICLCANCHRMIHRAIASSHRNVSLGEFKATIRN